MTYIRATTTQRGFAKQMADVLAMTDSTGGTPSRTIPGAAAVYGQADTNNVRASFADFGNDLRANARAAGQMA